MVEAEPEFDANERDAWYALADYEVAICPHCGMLRAICSDPGGEHGDGFYPQRSVCYARRATIAAQRAFDAKHDGEKPAAANGWLTQTDGVTVWAAAEDLTPDDDFL